MPLSLQLSLGDFTLEKETSTKCAEMSMLEHKQPFLPDRWCIRHWH